MSTGVHASGPLPSLGSEAPRNLAAIAAILADVAQAKIFRNSPDAVANCATAIEADIIAIVQTHAAQRAHIDSERLNALCRSMLPHLLASASVATSGPLGEIVAKLSEAYVADTKSAEHKVLSVIQGRIAAAPISELDQSDDTVFDSDLDTVEADETPVPLPAEGIAESLPEDELNRRQRRDLRELERELRFQEYVNETIRAIFDDLEPTDRLIAELYYLQGFDVQEIALVACKPEQTVRENIAQTREVWLTGHQSMTLCSLGNQIRREIDRQDLRLNETQGVTLLSHLLKTYPRLRQSTDLLNLVADSREFFANFLASERPEVRAFRDRILTKNGIDWSLLGRKTRALLGDLVTLRYPEPEDVRFEPILGTFLGVARHTTQQGRFAELDARFLEACIRRGFYSGKVHEKSALIVQYGSPARGRRVRNPLTRADVVDPDLAWENSVTLLRRTFPNLDSIRVETPGIFVAASILGVSKEASISTLRRAFVVRNVLSGRLPPNHTPPMATSPYFDWRCTPEDLEANRDALIRRRWANLDDPECDEYLALALGVPNTIEDLTRRAAKALGTVIPDRHPFKYNERLDSRYFDDLRYVTTEQREFNLAKAFQDTFGSLEQFTFEAATEKVGIRQLSRLLGIERESYRLIREVVRARGYLK